MNTTFEDYYDRAQQSPELKVLSMISSAWVTKIIYVSVKKGIFDNINSGLDTMAKLQAVTQIENTLLKRILSGLVHINLLKLTDKKHYILTHLGKLLLLSEENNFHHLAMLWGEEFYHAWGMILETVDNQKPGFDNYYNKNLFAYLGENPLVAANFDMAMSSLAQFIYPVVAEKIKLGAGQKIMDVGGGNGFLLSAILKKNPAASGILFDLPHVIERLTQQPPAYISESNIAYAQGDFFKAIPHAENHILANILHDWNDGDALKILHQVRATQQAGDTLYIVEMLLDHQQEPHLARSTDLNMLLLTGGRERTLAEIELLLTAANFKIELVENVRQMTCLIKASAT